jgi:membrane protein involved in colicin uptake
MNTPNPPAKPAAPGAPPSPLAALYSQARTVTGNNLKGAVRIVSLKELEKTVAESAKAHAHDLEEVRKAQDDLKKAQAEAKRLADLEAAARNESERQRAELARLGNHAAELESQAKAAEQARLDAVKEAEQRLRARITELETIIASDNARARVAFLEAEVLRLGALVDKYETGLEFITTIERPDSAADLALAESLKGRATGSLAARLDHIKAGIARAQRTVDEGLKLINEQKKGTLYGCTDLLEQALALSAYHQELLSIKQAFGS